MSSQNPYPPQTNASFPALHLYPLDESFVPKRIALGAGQRVKIARPPNTKTQPGERNGYFDSRVLSRQHAEVWEEAGKIFIKDVKSSNGTFINGERLSLEGRESEPYELKSDDILEFGVDIVSEDNRTVLHRKVVARVACVFPSRNGTPPPPLPHDQFATIGQAGVALNGMGAGAPPRRPQVPMIHQGLSGLGGMGGGARAPGRGLTLDHIFSRLQAELAKSRDTGHDLQVLTGALNNIEDTLNGALPATSAPQFPDVLPGVRPPPPRAMSVPSLPSVPAVLAETPPPPDAVAELQAQLREHQEALAAHVEGIRALEGVLAEQEAMKREVRELREFVGVDRHGGGEGIAKDGESPEEEEGEDDDDEDSDTQSVMTATPHELDRVDEEEEESEGGGFVEQSQSREEQAAQDAARSAQEDAEALQEEREENMMRERAQTPEPMSDLDSPSPPRSPPAMSEVQPPAPSSPAPSSPSTLSLTELTSRLALLTSQLESALAASNALQAQHASAQATIVSLEEKIARLEARPIPAYPSPPIAVPVLAPVSPSVQILEEMQSQLAAVRTELALERGRREAWADGVEARIRHGDLGAAVVVPNGQLGEGKVRRRRGYGSRGRSGSSASVSRSRSRRRRSESPDVGMDDSMRLEQLELGLDFKPVVLPGVVAEKSLRANTTTTQMNVQTALGVLILGMAAAAVLWRVKPE
ncbi:hypothetical protein DFH06DRAFT_1330598 [Mycena polygramma]|nr:hypothetical protein DFH06DRAFT_1330598 [Mycena polygramma]